MIELQQLTLSYGSVVPIRDASTQMRSPVSVVMGPSGSGKSSLLRVMAGVQAPRSGSVLLDGTQIKAASRTTAGDDRVVLIHQDYRLVDFLSVGDNIRLGAEMRGQRCSSHEVLDVLARVGLGEEHVSRLPATLSGGQQQRVAIARALACRVPLLLADEPTGALDSTNTMMIAELLHAVTGDGEVRVVVATHDERVAGYGTEVFDLTNGVLETRGVSAR